MVCGIVGLFAADFMRIPYGGAIGFVVGSYLGHYFWDAPKERKASDENFNAYKRRKGEFLFHSFRLCAKMAKTDGPINEREIKHMEYLMRDQFAMSDKGRLHAIKVWKDAKESNESFDQYARGFYNDFGRERHHVTNMLDLLFSMAASDGGLHPREEELLLKAAGIFHIGRLQYDRIKSRYYQSKGTSAPPKQHWNALDPHYAILNASSADSLDTIKKKYRALAMQWHPDRVVAKGLSTEAQRHAKEKFQKINEAYEKIVDARK